MSNLALNKLPIEKDTWKRPEDATDGNISQYDGENTLDLGKDTKISVIRFLLWDNLGRSNNNTPHSRKYNFSLSISSDGNKYSKIFTNQGEEGGNGWYSFQLLTGTYTRYIKFDGHFNSANDEIHIVEFEIHDQTPPRLASNNIHDFSIVTGIPSEESISELIDKILSNRSDIFKGLESKVALLDNTLIKSEESLQQIDLIKQSIDFQEESRNNNKRAMRWLITSISLLVATGIIVKDDYKNTSRGHVFIDAMKLVFAHQPSGFSNDENDSPSVVNTLLQKGISGD